MGGCHERSRTARDAGHWHRFHASTPPDHAQSAILGTYARTPITLVGGDGAELIAIDGRRYLDFTSGIAVNALGYGDPGLQATLRDAAPTGSFTSRTCSGRSPRRDWRCGWWRIRSRTKCFFCNSGAEANEGAFKFARRWARGVGGAEKHEIVALRGSFHGRLFASLAATDRPKYRAPFRPLAGGITIAERDIAQLAEMLAAETTAALVVEPVQGEGGVRVFDPGFLRELRSMTAERRIALVLDEVQCGLGRTGWLFAYERAGIEPDLLALAKPIAGGLPMGAVLLADHIASAIEPGDHGSTFGGGPFVSTVAQYVVERIAEPSLLQSVREHGEWLGASSTSSRPNRRTCGACAGLGSSGASTSRCGPGRSLMRPASRACCCCRRAITRCGSCRRSPSRARSSSAASTSSPRYWHDRYDGVSHALACDADSPSAACGPARGHLSCSASDGRSGDRGPHQ